ASTRRIASDLRARGVPMLDAPVTNISGGLSLMVGGSIRTFERMKPLLETLGVHATWVGESGAGHVVKLCQNLVTGVYTAVAAEAFVFARQAGIDPERLEAALLTTGAAPAARQFPNFRERRFAGRGQMALHSKDMWYMMQTAREIGAAVPFATMLHELFQLALHHGDADWTQAGLVTFFERAARPATGADGPG
ncbi:MAG TPA: NAD-binding protein, partial [Limnochordia bacterium]